MTNALLQKSIPYEEFDYQTLLDSIHGYAQPRMKISGMSGQRGLSSASRRVSISSASLCAVGPSAGNCLPTSSTVRPMFPSNMPCTIMA
jgi:hypothetical protein